jgi:hypothetical protein
MAHMSNSSAIDMTHDFYEDQTSTTSLFFLDFPLLQGIFCWGYGAPTSFPSYVNLSTSGFAHFDLVFSTGKGIAPFMFLGMVVAGENDSQLFWGS